MEKIKVVHLIKGLGRGGAERLLVSTIRNAGPGWSWEVIYFLENRNALVSDLEKLGCRVTCLPSYGVAGMFLQLPTLISKLRNAGAGVIHAHLPWSGIIARLAGLFTGIPVVYTEHNLFIHYKGLTRLFNRLTYRLQRAVIAVSDEVAAGLPSGQANAVPITVVNNGVDLQEFNPALFVRAALLENAGLPPDAFVVGNVASIRPQKRMDRWLAIAELVLEKEPKAHFLLVGGGAELLKIQDQVRKMAHNDRIHLVGLQPDPARWLAMMQVFLMSSDYEGMPVALLEAMAMGCVPVVTPAGGIPEIVTHGTNGYLYDSEAISDAAKLILALATDHEQKKLLSTEARGTVSVKFSVGIMVDQLKAVYLRVMPKRTNN